MSAVRRISCVAVAAAAAATVLTALPAQAAADGCWGTGPTVTDTLGQQWATRYCNNYRAGDVYNYVDGRWQPVGRLYAGDNWFVCQSHGPDNPPIGDWVNDIWLYTEADEAWAAGGWGGFPATHVSGGVNYGPIPGLGWCPWEEDVLLSGSGE
ncbi:hypothetical protein FH608_041280 [Nonomuraea phyllanthi]|uniref:Uncharacterized protein n=1 Tax=Nonomuraea phyllanthi TaxID=2219224 RepID=A0A5C4VHC2_9ACTN|nr:hypothetical protein [Nonomuraea phyllanthi]KAB8188923.1 hypothetical protein FH608_041280 [Nonomuraea phyllanthi]QFY09488.1 hypothetical protein GBF35_25115 [Nonomuraea phyllanthi]